MKIKIVNGLIKSFENIPAANLESGYYGDATVTLFSAADKIFRLEIFYIFSSLGIFLKVFFPLGLIAFKNISEKMLYSVSFFLELYSRLRTFSLTFSKRLFERSWQGLVEFLRGTFLQNFFLFSVNMIKNFLAEFFQKVVCEKQAKLRRFDLPKTFFNKNNSKVVFKMTSKTRTQLEIDAFIESLYVAVITKAEDLGLDYLKDSADLRKAAYDSGKVSALWAQESFETLEGLMEFLGDGVQTMPARSLLF